MVILSFFGWGQWLYNVVLAAAAEQSESALCTHVPLPSRVCFAAPPPPRALSWAPCAAQQLPTGWLFHSWWGIYVTPNLPVYPPPYPLPSHAHISVLYICVSFPAQQIGSEASIVFDGDFIIPVHFCVCVILLGLRKLERYSCNKYVIITNSGNKYPCNQICFLVVFGKSLIEKCSKICGHNSWKSKIIMIVGRTFSGFHWKHY